MWRRVTLLVMLSVVVMLTAVIWNTRPVQPPAVKASSHPQAEIAVAPPPPAAAPAPPPPIGWPDAGKAEYPSKIVAIDFGDQGSVTAAKSATVDRWKIEFPATAPVAGCTDNESNTHDYCEAADVSGLKCTHPNQGEKTCDLSLARDASTVHNCQLNFPDGFGASNEFHHVEFTCPQGVIFEVKQGG